MNDAIDRQRELARYLLAYEAGTDQSTSGLVMATELSFNRLYARLSVLIGADGFNALAKRALHLATLECAFLGSVTAQAEQNAFRLQGLGASVEGREPAEVRVGLVAILGFFFWLLVTFVGENLFNRLIRGVWPDVRFGDVGLGSEEKHE